MIKGRKVYDPLTDTWSTGYWVADDKGNYYPVWQKKNAPYQKGDYMAKYKDIFGNVRECEDKTITISLERYNTLIIKEAIADCLVEAKKKEKEDNQEGKEQ